MKNLLNQISKNSKENFQKNIKDERTYNEKVFEQ